MQDSFGKTPEFVCDFFLSDLDRGLSLEGASKASSKFGLNELPPVAGTPFFHLVIKQFQDLLVLILLAAAAISFVLGCLEENDSLLNAFVEPSVILLILIANAIVGVIQETNAEKAIERLKDFEARTATVIRDGKPHTISASKLVPGDLIRVAVGDKIPADCRIVKLTSATLAIDESMLTGEPIPVFKQVEPIDIERPVNQDKVNMLFSGTLAVRGRCLGMVVNTGSRTELGHIQFDLQNDDDDDKTPLQQKLDIFAEQLSKAILVICILVWVVNITHFTDPAHGGFLKGAIYYFKIAVALAVAAIPEGLPAVVTTCLALGTMKMAKKNAIVRSLPSVETLGCTTVICSDKTGTLTTNKMSVRCVFTIDGYEKGKLALREYEVTGLDFSPYGEIFRKNGSGKTYMEFPALDYSLSLIGRVSAVCNESHLTYTKKLDVHEYGITGEATEAALCVLSEKIGLPDKERAKVIFSSNNPHIRICAAHKFWNDSYKREALLDFSRDRKSMSVLSHDTLRNNGKMILHVKGAPESILRRCNSFVTNSGEIIDMTQEVRNDINQSTHKISSQGFRVIAFAVLNDPSKDFQYNNLDHYAHIESKMTFIGLAGMFDPPRKEVTESIAKCKSAGIKVMVITGDNKATAEAICRDIGVFGRNEDVKDKSLNGTEFMELSEIEQNEIVKHATLFSRVEPNHKLHLVNLLRKQGEVVAMTGDGVNDAPALRKADIAIAMGTGTAVAREASDIVLQDDNFATIVMAVEEGRAIYANTKQFIRYLISSNIGEVICIFLTAAIGMPEALIPVQLLWVNLVTDGLPATALGFNQPDNDIMRLPPRGRHEKIIDGWMFFRYVFIGLYIGVGTVFGFI